MDRDKQSLSFIQDACDEELANILSGIPAKVVKTISENRREIHTKQDLITAIGEICTATVLDELAKKLLPRCDY